jgi:hypothetical protein
MPPLAGIERTVTAGNSLNFPVTESTAEENIIYSRTNASFNDGSEYGHPA